MITTTSTPLRTLAFPGLLLIALSACGGGGGGGTSQSSINQSVSSGSSPNPAPRSVLSLRAALPQENSSLIQ